MIQSSIRNLSRAAALGLVLCGTLLNSSIARADGEKTVVFAGMDFAEESYYYHGGAIHAPGGLGTSGLMLRAAMGAGEYNYETPGLGGLDVEGHGFQGEALVGWGFYSESGHWVVFAGGSYSDNDLSPDDSNNDSRADEFGVKGHTEFSTSLSSAFRLSGAGSYTTAHESYWSRLRLGTKVGSFHFGPEAGLIGGDQYETLRFGAFVEFPLRELGWNVNLAGGYNDFDGDDRNDRTSAYGSVGMSMAF